MITRLNYQLYQSIIFISIKKFSHHYKSAHIKKFNHFIEMYVILRTQRVRCISKLTHPPVCLTYGPASSPGTTFLFAAPAVERFFHFSVIHDARIPSQSSLCTNSGQTSLQSAGLVLFVFFLQFFLTNAHKPPNLILALSSQTCLAISGSTLSSY